MSDFEKKKEEYLERLSTKQELLISLAKKKDDDSLAALRILVDPRDENGLKVANYSLDLLDDLLNLVTSASCGNVVYVPVEENEGLKAITSVMKMLISDEEVTAETIAARLSKSNESNIIPEQLAEIIFGLTVCFICEPVETMTYIGEKMGISFENEVDLIRLQVLLEEAKEKMQTLQPNQNVYKEMTDKSVNWMVAFSTAFHNLCEKNIKKEDSKSLTLKR